MSKSKPKVVTKTADLNLGQGSLIAYKKKFIQPHLASETGTVFRQLMGETKFEQKDLVLLGKKVKQPRLVAYYATDIKRGSFTYSGLRNIPSHFTPFVEQLKNSVQECVKEEFDSVLLNYYRDGRDTVGWHADNEQLYGDEPTIASLSLGSARDFILRKNDDHNNKYKFVLGPGDLLVMKGKVQQQWQHTVPRRSPPQSIGPRINLTFRRIVHPESQTRSPKQPRQSLKQPTQLPLQPPPPAASPNLQASAPMFPNLSATEPASSPSEKFAVHSTQSLLDPCVWQLRIEKQEQNKVGEQAALLQQAKAGQQVSQHTQQQQQEQPQGTRKQLLQQPEQQQQQQQQLQEAALAVSSGMQGHEPPSREPSPLPKVPRSESQVPTQQPDPGA